jgi:hypothetical protein
MQDKTQRLVAMAIALVFVAAIAATFEHCSIQSDRRAECLKGGASAADCKTLFPLAGEKS